MQHRINLYLNDENPIDAKIWEVLKDKKKRPDVIKAMLLGLIELEKQKPIERIPEPIEDDLSDMDDIDEIDL